MLPVLAKVTERTKKKIEPFEKNQKDNFIVNRKITNCCYNIKIYVMYILVSSAHSNTSFKLVDF
jgi:hypothetical protein